MDVDERADGVDSIADEDGFEGFGIGVDVGVASDEIGFVICFEVVNEESGIVVGVFDAGFSLISAVVDIVVDVKVGALQKHQR